MQQPQRPAPPQAQQSAATDPFEAAQDDQPFAQASGHSGGDLPDSFDFTDVPDSVEYEVLPPGTYDATVDSVEYVTAQSSGNPMLTWSLTVHVHEEAGDRDIPMRYHTSFSEKALPRTKRQLITLNPEMDITRFRPGDADDMFAGMEVRARIRVQTGRADSDYPGRRNQIQVLQPQTDAFVG